METAAPWWRGLRDFATWFIVGALPSGAMLFALLLWLSHRFVHDGFGHVRQHAFAPVGKSSLRASMQRNWWSCTCAGVGTCACLSAIARGMRRCCAKAQSELSSLLSMEPSVPGVSR